MNPTYDYDHWANTRLADVMSNAEGVPQKALALLAHIVGAQRIWYTRIVGGDMAGLVVWPVLTLDECRREIEEMHRLWREYLQSATPERLASAVTYRTMNGVEYTSRVEDILMHVTMHSMYHRGQIASALKGAGIEPPVTDFIAWVR